MADDSERVRELLLELEQASARERDLRQALRESDLVRARAEHSATMSEYFLKS